MSAHPSGSPWKQPYEGWVPLPPESEPASPESSLVQVKLLPFASTFLQELSSVFSLFGLINI